MNGNTRSIRGYTLVELIVVIALIGIVLSVAVPSIGIIFKTSEKKELMEFKRDLIFARNSAVMENAQYTVNLDIIENQYYITKDNKKPANIIKRKKFVNGIILKADNLDHHVTFHSNGSVEKAGTIRLENRKKEKIYISITPATGKINLKFN